MENPLYTNRFKINGYETDYPGKMSQKAPSEVGLFTLEFVISIGGDDSRETRDMIHTLNIMTGLWGPVATAHMTRFLNLVKSKTDELALTLQGEHSTTKAPVSGKNSGEVVVRKGKGPSDAEQGKAQQPTNDFETKFAKAHQEIQDLKNKNHELTLKMKNGREKSLEMLINSYNKKCIELDCLKDESTQNLILFSEQNSIFAGTKARLERKLMEKETLISELETQAKSKMQPTQEQFAKLLHGPQMVLTDSSQEGSTCCPVPMRNGGLVSLKFVYNFWKENGVSWIPDDQTYPSFNGMLYADNSISVTQYLSNPSQIQTFHEVFVQLGLQHEPPFKIQFRDGDDTLADEDTEWSDIIFFDQIRIASIMYHMKCKQEDASQCLIQRRTVQQNQLLITISLHQETFKFEIWKASLQELHPIQCRISSIDPTFDLYKA